MFMRQSQTSHCVQKRQPQVSDPRSHGVERDTDISMSAMLSSLQVRQARRPLVFIRKLIRPEGCQCDLEVGREQYRQAFSVDKVPVPDCLGLRRRRRGAPARPNCRYRQRCRGEMRHSCRIISTNLTLKDVSQKNDPYPREELEWLATTAFNRAVDYYCASDDGVCTRWAERAMAIATLNNDGDVLHSILQSKFAGLNWGD